MYVFFFKGGFPREDRIIGTEAGCHFGYSLAALGDINRDGFNGRHIVHCMSVKRSLVFRTTLKPQSHCPGSAVGLATDLPYLPATDDPWSSTIRMNLLPFRTVQNLRGVCRIARDIRTRLGRIYTDERRNVRSYTQQRTLRPWSSSVGWSGTVGLGLQYNPLNMLN